MILSLFASNAQTLRLHNHATQKYRVFVVFAVLAALLAIGNAATAATVQVGACRSGLTSFTTIQAAVIAVPAGSTILVCPGTYREQVTIPKALTVRGVRSGTLDQAIIAAPAGGVAQNTTSLSSGNPIASQVLVTGAQNVTLSSLTVDGSNNGINACSPNLIGIFYRNASGSVEHVVAINQALVVADNGCQSGLGIFVQSGQGGHSNVNVSRSHVENYQKNGITGNEAGTRVSIFGNTVVGQGSTTGAAENSIQIGFGAGGAITENVAIDNIFAPDTITDPGDAAAGILVFASSGVTVADNTVGNSQFGIALVSDATAGSADGGQVTGNQVTSTRIFDGIDLCSNGNRVIRNSISGSSESAIHLDSACGAVNGNRVIGNSINGACAGVLIGTGAGTNILSGNEFFNVHNTTLVADQAQCGSSALPNASSLVRTATQSRHYSPARP